MHRLFVALRPPRAMREMLLGLMEGLSHARWQDDDQLHCTLRFIGAVDGRMAEDIADMLGQLRHPALTLAPAGVGCFDRKGRIDALWAGVTPRDGVTALHRKIDAALVRLGLPPEGRAYRPHITLARFGRGGAGIEPFLARHAGLSGAPARFDTFCLYESRLGAAGAQYEIVARYPLG